METSAAGVQKAATLSANAYWTLSPEGVMGQASTNLTKPLALPVATS